jgi:flagellar protein FlgJ
MASPLDARTATAGIAADSRTLDRLRTTARDDPRAALNGAAKQFEAVFVNMLLKSMRDALPQDGPFQSDTTRMYTGMLDQQLAQDIAGKGIGLADMLVKQLERHPSVAQTGAGRPMPEATPAAAPAAPARPASPIDARVRRSAHPTGFVEKLLPHAQAAAAETGLPARFILGQAALESGWGRGEIRRADGSTSFNLFGIKAGRGWTGKTVEVMTTEYTGGVPRKVMQTFRAYDSYAEAFADWSRLLTQSPRYAKAVAAGSDGAAFARELQAAGYATDPGYADKLTRVLNSALLRRTPA